MQAVILKKCIKIIFYCLRPIFFIPKNTRLQKGCSPFETAAFKRIVVNQSLKDLTHTYPLDDKRGWPMVSQKIPLTPIISHDIPTLRNQKPQLCQKAEVAYEIMGQGNHKKCRYFYQHMSTSWIKRGGCLFLQVSDWLWKTSQNKGLWRYVLMPLGPLKCLEGR